MMCSRPKNVILRMHLRKFSTSNMKLWRVQPQGALSPMFANNVYASNVESTFDTSLTINTAPNKDYSCLKDTSMIPSNTKDYSDLFTKQLLSFSQNIDNNYFVGSEYQYPILSSINIIKALNQFFELTKPLSEYLITNIYY